MRLERAYESALRLYPADYDISADGQRFPTTKDTRRRIRTSRGARLAWNSFKFKWLWGHISSHPVLFNRLLPQQVAEMRHRSVASTTPKS